MRAKPAKPAKPARPTKRPGRETSVPTINDVGRAELSAALTRAAAGKAPLAELLAAWSIVPAAELADVIATVDIAPELAEIVSADSNAGFARLSQREAERDPRLADVLIGWLADPPWHSTSTQPFYKLVLQRLEAIADPRSIDGLTRASKAMQKVVKGKSMRGWLVERIGLTRDALRALVPGGVPALTPAERKLVAGAAKALADDRSAGLPKQPTGRAKTAVDLLAAIRADPRDDAPRHVYGDVLVEKGDPRGTFITMQLARAGRAPTPAERKAEVALLAQHARVWLGELAGVVGGLTRDSFAVGPERTGTQIRFERGFLAGCFIGRTPKRVAAVAGNPELATVEELTLYSEGAVVLQKAHLPALRSLHIPAALLDLVHAAPFASRLEMLECTGEPSPAFAENVKRCATLAALRRLELDLHANEIDVPVRDVITAALALPQVEQFGVNCYGSLVFERTGKRWRLIGNDEGMPDRMVTAIRGLVET
ncbi:MAG: TIGR02996 domain-containing protein [Myxococcota bacterium]|nr:TIGR02996 domain-containing protein [Myxococcota bacterium]